MKILLLYPDLDHKELIHITVSIGLTLLDPNVSVEKSVEHADKAMYAAKSDGRHCVKIWEPTM